MATEVEVNCTKCSQKFSVHSTVLASRVLDVCMTCFRDTAFRMHLTGPPPIFRPDHIDSKVFLGGYRCALELKTLEEYNITHVLVCGAGLSQYFPQKIKYLQYYVEDEIEVDLSAHFQSAFDFIENISDGNVLVHCHAGVSRSATIVLSYLMKKKGLRLSEALQLVKSKRRCINPNNGFMMQLENYENLLFETQDKTILG